MLLSSYLVCLAFSSASAIDLRRFVIRDEVDAIEIPLPEIEDGNSPATWQCDVRAWVKAPDLEVDLRAVGKARLHANGSDCADIASWGVSLHMKERSVVRLPAAGVTMPVKPICNSTLEAAYHSNRSAIWDYSDARDSIFIAGHEIWNMADTQSPYEAQSDAYKLAMRNESLWQVKSAERIAFETEVQLGTFGESKSTSVKTIEHFGIAVPLVQLPAQSSGFMSSWRREEEVESVTAETSLAYNLVIDLKNGSRIIAPAGHTSFIPSRPTNASRAEPQDVTLHLFPLSPRKEPEPHCWGRGGEIDEPEVRGSASPDFELRFHLPDSGHFRQGDQLPVQVTIRSLNASSAYLPSYVAIAAQTRTEYAWASRFGATEEQRKLINRLAYPAQVSRFYGHGEHHMRQRMAVPAKSRMQEEADREGGSSWSGTRWVNGTTLAGQLEETATVQMTIPYDLMPETTASFVDFVNLLQVQLETRKLENIVNRYADEDDDDAWSAHLPYNHDSKEAAIRNYYASTSIHVQPSMETKDKVVSHLSAEALAPLLLPVSQLKDKDLPFVHIDTTLRAESAELSKKQQRYQIDFNHKLHDGRHNYVGQVWMRSLRREQDAKMITPKLVQQQSG